MPPELEAGTVIASYRIEALIGEGAASKVYRARDAEGSLVALKLLDGAGAGDARFRQRFLRESD
jgi:serine/threonine protein kinase